MRRHRHITLMYTSWQDARHSKNKTKKPQTGSQRPMGRWEGGTTVEE